MSSLGRDLVRVWVGSLGLALISCGLALIPTYLRAQAPSVQANPQQAQPGAGGVNQLPNPGAGAQTAQPPPQGSGGEPAAAPAVDINAMVTAPKDLLLGIIERFEYDPADLRDPFQPYNPSKGNVQAQGPVLPLQRFDLEQLKVIAIIWDVADPKAMIEDPQGNTSLVRMNERVGRNNGYIAAIREGEVVVVEAFDNAGNISYKTRVMKVGGEKKL